MRMQAALSEAAKHCDGMASTGTTTARRLAKMGLVDDLGQGRICITEKGLALIPQHLRR